MEAAQEENFARLRSREQHSHCAVFVVISPRHWLQSTYRTGLVCFKCIITRGRGGGVIPCNITRGGGRVILCNIKREAG